MKADILNAIGLELADIRRSKKLSILDVADATSVNKDTISKYENANSSMKIYILNILLEYYNINFAVFFARVNDRMQNKMIKK